MQKYWKVQALPLKGSYAEVLKKARFVFSQIKKHTKRKPYIRSAYFKRKKVFFDHFWTHLFHKPKRQRRTRLQLLACGVELIKESNLQPVSRKNPSKSSENLLRFYGETKHGHKFIVQLKQTSTSLQFTSVFPQEK